MKNFLGYLIFYWVPSWRWQRRLAKRFGKAIMLGDRHGWQVGNRTIILDPIDTSPESKAVVNIRAMALKERGSK